MKLPGLPPMPLGHETHKIAHVLGRTVVHSPSRAPKITVKTHKMGVKTGLCEQLLREVFTQVNSC